MKELVVKLINLIPTIIITFISLSVKAHFQLLLPDSDIIYNISKPLDFKAIFTHPMENGPIMNMGRPVRAGVISSNGEENLLSSLKNFSPEGKKAYILSYKFKKPGDYVFFIEPAPYWEQSEQKMIIHYTKIVVDVMGAGDGWDKMVGFPIEIEPLVRPYGFYTGNIFRGIVKKDGKPLPFAEVEVEMYNQDKKYDVPSDVFITQVVKTDANGVFSYAVPKAGWWGFAALVEGEKMKGPGDKEVDVELGGIIWIKAVDMKERKK